ncbi:MAG TPA: PilN domain-containing protein [Kofleriaceae bacterium]|nr:PilN domain-containing protein [Kofleriaceae bacterium]
MIKINLLPQKRAKLRVARAREPGGADIWIGVGALVAVAVIVFFALDQPKRARLRELADQDKALQTEVNEKTKALQGYSELKKAADEADARAISINRLINAKIVPANVLHELGEILTPNHLPTMTETMAKLTGTGLEGDPNKRIDLTWDPTHVWLTSYVDKKGDFTLEGGAQTEGDVTQLSKRLAASVYFVDVSPSREDRVNDKDSGITYYKFTITGKVAY